MSTVGKRGTSPDTTTKKLAGTAEKRLGEIRVKIFHKAFRGKDLTQLSWISTLTKSILKKTRNEFLRC
jgi:hypothetical protein